MRTLIAVSSSLGGVYLADKFYFGSSIERSLRTAAAGLVITYEYKFKFKPGHFESVHQRAADVILETCTRNAGLYIKFAQQIASAGSILPPQYSNFKKLYDQAPSVSFSVVKSIIEREFAAPIDTLFTEFNETPVASASIAQVHRAVLKNGDVVAVKVQKPEIAVQMDMDLLAFKVVSFALEKLFDLPLYWTADYIETHLRQEVDFINEARNSEQATSDLITKFPHLSHSIHIPKVYHHLTTPKVLTAEWIDGVQFGDVDAVEKLGYSVKHIMTDVIDFFSNQIFNTGFIHCDPHPGNILIRPHPLNQKAPQIVLLDHGLYVKCDPSVTHDYAVVWKSLFTHEIDVLESILNRWGIQDVELFASGTMQRVWKTEKGVREPVNLRDVYDLQIQAKERVRKYLSDTNRVPKELIFIGRNLNIVRSNNKAYGSPVNRINLMVHTAVKSLGNDWSIWSSKPSTTSPSSSSLIQSRLQPFFNHFQARYLYFRFQFTLFSLSMAYHASNMWYRMMRAIWGGQHIGFENVLEESARIAIYNQTGVWLEADAFDA